MTRNTPAPWWSDPVVSTAESGTQTWGDVVRWSRSVGRWAKVQRAATRALSALDADESALATVDLPSREGAWRRRRGLITADALRARLTAWDLSVSRWRTLLTAEALVEGRHDDRPASDELLGWDSRDVLDHSVITGTLDVELDARLTDLLAREVLHTRGVDDPSDPDEVLAVFANVMIDADALHQHVARRALDWTEVDALTLVFADRDPAAEARLCVHHDGDDPIRVADISCAEVVREHGLLTDLSAARQRLLRDAPQGKVVGPRERADGRWEITTVQARRPANPADPVLRENALRELVRLAIDGAGHQRLDWHEGTHAHR